MTPPIPFLLSRKVPTMTRKLISLAAAAVAATALAPAAGAADNPATPLKVTGAYLYLDHNAASKQDFVRVVFRTASELQRRGDGSIQAGVSVDGVSHSIGAVKKGSTLYTGAAEVKGRSITAFNDKQIRKAAKIGRSFTVRFFTRDGQKITRKLVLRPERKGDDAGKPLAH
jgi:hypothetical protein